MSKNHKVLVTGSAGYIGQHLVQILKSIPDIEVWCLDHKPVSGATDTIMDIRYPIKDFHFSLADAPIEYDTVIHLAALIRVGESTQYPTLYYETNVEGTKNVLKSISFKNFIFASTGAAEEPSSPYALSKRMAEDIVHEFCTKNSIDFTTFRFYNVVGSDGFTSTNEDGIFLNLKKAIETKKFYINGYDYDTPDGTCVREYVHVNDICWAMIKAIKEPANGIENLAYGDARTVKEIVYYFKKANNVEFDIILQGRRPGDAESYYLKNPSPYMQCNYTYEQMFTI